MLTIKGTVIKLTRGDSAYIPISINVTSPDGNSTKYEYNDGDKIHCQVRTVANVGELLIDGKIVDGTGNQKYWYIKPSDTSDLEPGIYYWDAQLELPNGDIFTFIPVSKFIITDEVTMHDR